MQDFHQLDVWRKAHVLVLRVYTASKQLPASENLGLTIHLRRSVVANACGIAEGCGRAVDMEFALDLNRARAAGHELEYVLLLCRDLWFLPAAIHDELREETLEVRKMITGLVKRLSALLEPVR